MFQDVRYALRLWAGRPCQTGFAIAALAIDTGANTCVFSVVTTLLLRSLPFREPDRLALVHGFIPPHDTAKQIHEWSQQSTYLSDAALFAEIDVNLGGTRVASWVCTRIQPSHSAEVSSKRASGLASYVGYCLPKRGNYRGPLPTSH
jgi:hypothetical protein